jgi:hypothetical protein
MDIQYNQVLVGNIDITDTYAKLMKASTSQDSIYIKAKETMQDFYDNNSGLTDTQKATMMSQMITEIAKSVSSESMQLALKIDMENRDAPYALTKLKADTMLISGQIFKIGADIDIAQQELINQRTAGWISQATAYRDYGVQTWNMVAGQPIVPATAYIDYGIKVQTIKKATADTYMSYASSYRKDGNVAFTTNADGSFNTVHGDLSGLTYYQTGVAKRQIKGFEDNMRQHIVNSSASMISMLLTANVPGVDYAPYLLEYSNAANYLATTNCNSVCADEILSVIMFSKALFYGGYVSTYVSTTTLLSSTATLVQAETSVGTARSTLAGANVGTNALFYGGDNISGYLNTTTLLSLTAVLVQAETSVGIAITALAGANVGTNALFYGGDNDSGYSSTATLLSPTTTLVQAEISVGTAKYELAGANVDINALFYGGYCNSGYSSIATVLSPTAVLIQAEASVGAARYTLSGANVGVNALFYGGNDSVDSSTATLLSPTATLVQAEASIGTARRESAGANVGVNALFYGGIIDVSYSSTATLLSPTATLVQAETSVGTARYTLSGASL